MVKKYLSPSFSPSSSTQLTQSPVKQITTEVLSGLAVSLVMIPEAIAFSLLLGATPTVGISTSVVIAIIMALFGGMGAVISGASSVAIVLALAVKRFGLAYMLPTVALSGVFHILIAFTGAYKIIDFVPPTVISGFLLGLAVLIALAQLQHFKEGKGVAREKEEGFIENNITEKKSSSWMTGRQLLWTVGLTFASIIVLIVLEYLRPPIPSVIILIAIGTLALWWIPRDIVPIMRVGDFGNIKLDLESFMPSYNTGEIVSREGGWVRTILMLLPYALSISVAGLSENLLALRRLRDTMGFEGSLFKESWAMGLANIASAFTGGISGNCVVGQTLLNVENGARSRLSSLTAGVALLVEMGLIPRVIENIPMPSLIAVMGFVVYSTGDWKALRNFTDKSGYFVMVVTIFAAVMTSNMAIGMAVGTVLHYVLRFIGYKPQH